MSAQDLLWVIALVLLLTWIVTVARRLARASDWQERLANSQATVYQRLWDLGFWLVHHLHRAIATPGHRRWHISRSLLAACLFAAVALTPLLALTLMAQHDLAHHIDASGVGGLLWAAVVESPGMVQRIGRVSPEIEFISPLALGFILLIADTAVGWLVLSGAIQGQPLTSVCQGAAFVAAADLVSVGIGVTEAAFQHYPFTDRPENRK